MMELSSATCTVMKRKSVAPEGHADAKRLKTGLEPDQTERGCSAHSPKILVHPSHMQQPVTLSGLTELLHYAAFGKKGGLKQPR